MKTVFCLLAASTLGLALPVVAQTTTNTLSVVSGPTGARGSQIMAFGPIGQSFTAIDSTLTSFGFQFQLFNAGSANPPLTFSLLGGAGLSGTALYSASLALPAALPSRTGTFYDFSVPDLQVTIGNVYTAVLSSTSDRVGLALGPEYNIFTGAPLGSDAYTGGQAYFTKPSFPNCTSDASSNCDLNFRVTGTRALVTAVPEASSWAMMILGMGMVGGVMRRRQKVATRASYAA